MKKKIDEKKSVMIKDPNSEIFNEYLNEALLKKHDFIFRYGFDEVDIVVVIFDINSVEGKRFAKTIFSASEFNSRVSDNPRVYSILVTTTELFQSAIDIIDSGLGVIFNVINKPAIIVVNGVYTFYSCKKN